MGAVNFPAAYRPAQTFLTLGEGYADPVQAANFPQAILRFRNDRHAKSVGLDALTDEQWCDHFARFAPLPDTQPTPLAMRYHGHQFRHYNPDIGDGRGFLFAQLYDQAGNLLDLGTKGSGTTPYSRAGDGRLTLKGGVREILASEMLEALGVNTSKTFSLIETGEPLMRGDEPSPTRSAVMVRLSQGHIRIGTFQRLAYYSETNKINALIRYCLEHYFGEKISDDAATNALLLLDLVGERTAKLAAETMAAGFVHGVLNSDNINITGESFDYGPWRFLPTLDLNFTAAYFDEQGLYAYGRQADSIYWDLYQLGGTLTDIADEQKIRDSLDAFPKLFRQAMRETLLNRLGVQSKDPKSDDVLLTAMNDFLIASAMPYEQLFFDWYGGEISKNRAAASPNLPHYSHESFSHFETALSAYSPMNAKALDHAYFQASAPCTMLIDEVEDIWSHIDQRDDWSALYDKVKNIREMGDAFSP